MAASALSRRDPLFPPGYTAPSTRSSSAADYQARFRGLDDDDGLVRVAAKVEGLLSPGHGLSMGICHAPGTTVAFFRVIADVDEKGNDIFENEWNGEIPVGKDFKFVMIKDADCSIYAVEEHPLRIIKSKTLPLTYNDSMIKFGKYDITEVKF